MNRKNELVIRFDTELPIRSTALSSDAQGKIFGGSCVREFGMCGRNADCCNFGGYPGFPGYNCMFLDEYSAKVCAPANFY
jgi:hypothetical protein